MVKIGVLISGGGSNLQAIIDQVHNKDGEIAVVISNKSKAYGLTRAKSAGIATEVLIESDYHSTEAFNQALVKKLKDYSVDLVVLAGYMRIVDKDFISAFTNRIINVHPALIPAFCGDGFYGMNVHNAVYDYGAKISGATVHLVSEITDGGPIIAQKSVEITSEDTPEIIQKKVLELEHILLPEAVKNFCTGKISVQGRRVSIKNKNEELK